LECEALEKRKYEGWCKIINIAGLSDWCSGGEKREPRVETKVAGSASEAPNHQGKE
jgi:hypothetical protein